MTDPRSPRPCRFCVAAHEFGAEDCGFTHEQPAEVVAPLAREMARLFQGEREPSDEKVGWFMQDAADVLGDFDPLPDEWKLRRLPDSGHEFVARFRINDHTYVIENGEGRCPPVRLATLRAWQREADAIAAAEF